MLIQILTREPIADVKFRRPVSSGRHGYTQESGIGATRVKWGPLVCDMSAIHKADVRGYGMRPYEKIARDSLQAARMQALVKK